MVGAVPPPQALASTPAHLFAPTAAITGSDRWTDVLLLAACLAGATGVSLLLRQDANWDLQNYHYYNPWAWLSGRNFDWDIAAAQLQTFHNALPDLPFYAMVAAGWPPRLIASALAIPTGLAMYFLAKLLQQLFHDLPQGERRVAIPAAFAIGATPAIGIGVIGTTMNDWPLVALVLPALWLVAGALVRSQGNFIPRRTLIFAGVLCGLAAGLKLTAATFAVGLCAAILLRGPYGGQALRRAFGEALGFGIAVLIGTALSLGPWAWSLWVHYGSPVFPYFNEWIHSPWWYERPILERLYGPHSLGAWLAFPFNLLSPKAFFVAEVGYRDARMPVTYALAIVAGAAWLSLRARGQSAMPRPTDAGVSRAWHLVTAFFVVSFAMWAAQYSAYRFLITLDMLTGALIVTMLQRMLRPGLAPGVIILLAVTLIATTRPASWWRVDFGPEWFTVTAPAIEPQALVLLTSDEPMAYVLPFLPADARFAGIDNSINRPWFDTRLHQSIARAVREHRGPLYALSYPATTGDQAIRTYGLVRTEENCAKITTNMSTSPLSLCRLARLPVTTP